MWGYPAEAKVFNPNKGKLDSKTVSCHFIGYPEKSKGYRFYCPDRHTKFVETRHAVFLEDDMVRGGMCNTPGVSHLLGSGFELKHGMLSDNQQL